MIFFANILDPTCKLEYMEFSLSQMYGELYGANLLSTVKYALYELYADYIVVYEFGNVAEIQSQSSHLVERTVSDPVGTNLIGKPKSVLKAKFKKHKMDIGLGGCKKTELETYLTEAIIEEEGNFDVLRWWKLNSERFPTLSRLASDVLAVPISTVASELAFSTSSRVLDAFRSSLTPRMVEALICTQDWIRVASQPISIEESIDELENFEKGKFIYM